MKIKFTFLCVFFLLNTSLYSQESDSAMIKKIFTAALSHGTAYSNLGELCRDVGGRLSGSDQAAKAVVWAKQTMQNLKADSVYLQEVMVPHWVRGEKESAQIVPAKGNPIEVKICALGGSVATSPEGLTGNVVEVFNVDTLEKLGRKVLEGKIVFFNGPMDPTEVFAFHAYGKAIAQRWAGPSAAAKYGAIATICRSMTLATDDYSHTGAMRYKDSIPKVPCCAISTIGANKLSAELKKASGTKFHFKQSCMDLPDVLSFNVIGEIRGTEKPDQVIVAGGHLDSWDLGEGAHDDGAGVVQTMEVIRIFKSLGLIPKHTIRIVAFMNEENGLRGGKKYADVSKNKKEKHLAALESDGGGFSPRGFSFEGDSLVQRRLESWKPLLLPYGLYEFSPDGGGADISPLRDEHVPLFELRPDSQRYFDFHHTAKDTFENVHKRELELGAASMAALIYLIDKYGF